MLRTTLFTDKEEQAPTRDGFGKALLELGSNDRVVALCADLTESVKMQAFKDAYPERFLEMGICEQSMASVASGIASMGYIPFMASYAMFSPGRNWEQIRTTICYNDMPVKIVGAHAGISVGPDGATHQALEDIAIMRVIPNMSVVVPCDSVEMYKATLAIASHAKPYYLRMTREKTPVMTEDTAQFALGKAYTMYIPKKEYAYQVGIIGAGPILYEALKAARELEGENIGVTVVNMHTIKPLDTDFLYRFITHHKRLVVVEEHQTAGGLGSAIVEALAAYKPVPVEFVGVENRFGQSGTPKELYEEYGLTSAHIKEKVKKVLGR
jgi:transketolase